jgi:hypothetical protein
MRVLLAALAATALLAPALSHESWIGRGGHRNAAGELCRTNRTLLCTGDRPQFLQGLLVTAAA